MAEPEQLGSRRLRGDPSPHARAQHPEDGEAEAGGRQHDTDNLVLMRLNSAADAAFAQAVVSFVPPSLTGQAAAFGLGEALVAGKISPHPALLRFGARVAEEGGSDVPAGWVRRRVPSS